MTVEKIERKHSPLVEGYEGMLPESKIKYHSQITLQAIVEELHSLQEVIGSMSPNSWQILENRAEELQKLIDNQ